MVSLRDKFSVTHIIQEGARFHVHSYSLVRSRKRLLDSFSLAWCSEPFCETNYREVLRCVEEGHDPAKLCPCTDAKSWLATDEGRAAVKAASAADTRA